jgi:hypothetical protein
VSEPGVGDLVATGFGRVAARFVDLAQFHPTGAKVFEHTAGEVVVLAAAAQLDGPPAQMRQFTSLDHTAMRASSLDRGRDGQFSLSIVVASLG